MAACTLVIPAYNEETNIVATIKETVKVLEAFNPSYEIIVINDGSRDKTCEKVAGFIYSGNSKVKIQSYFPNRGKGYALKYGTDFANGNLILFLDADLDLAALDLDLARGGPVEHPGTAPHGQVLGARIAEMVRHLPTLGLAHLRPGL
jgi:glycosyltransferase involved in cell wall biosynthesis